jgi:hypothetical protein
MGRERDTGKKAKCFASQEEIERDGQCQAKETPMRQAIK